MYKKILLSIFSVIHITKDPYLTGNSSWERGDFIIIHLLIYLTVHDGKTL